MKHSGMVTFALILTQLPFSLQQTLQQQVPLHAPEHVSSPFTASFDTYVDELLSEWHTPGMAIAVVKGGQTWSKVTLALIFCRWLSLQPCCLLAYAFEAGSRSDDM